MALRKKTKAIQSNWKVFNVSIEGVKKNQQITAIEAHRTLEKLRKKPFHIKIFFKNFKGSRGNKYIG